MYYKRVGLDILYEMNPRFPLEYINSEHLINILNACDRNVFSSSLPMLIIKYLRVADIYIGYMRFVL